MLLFCLHQNGYSTEFFDFVNDTLSIRGYKKLFPIGGLVAIGETHIAPGSRYYLRLINFVLKLHDHRYLFQALKELKDLTPVRISLYILKVKAECLTMFYF